MPQLICIVLTLFTGLRCGDAERLPMETLGAAPGVPEAYGGLCIEALNTGTLLVGARAESPDAVIHAVPLVRDGNGHIVGFEAPSSFFASAPGLDGGGLNGSLNYFDMRRLSYCASPEGSWGQIYEGDDGPTELQDLSLQLDAPLAAQMLAPGEFPGSSWPKLMTTDPGQWFSCQYFIKGDGTIIYFVDEMITTLSGSPTSMTFTWLDGVPLVLIAKSEGRIDAYQLDAEANPIPETECILLADLDGITGLATDPLTNDLIISTSTNSGGADEIIVVGGFDEPCLADLNDDGVVDTNDLLLVMSEWLDDCYPWCDNDATLDGYITTDDLLLILEQWGPCP